MMTRPALLLLLFVLAPRSDAAERFPPIAPDAMTAEPRAIANAIASGPRKDGSGPFAAGLRPPVLAAGLQEVGDDVRFQASLPKRLDWFAIPIADRWWNSSFEWACHYPLAIGGGVVPGVFADLSRGVEPSGMTPDYALVFRLCQEPRRDHTVSDATCGAVLRRFGERGIIDLVAVTGYDDAACMTLDVAKMPVPAGSAAPPLDSLPAATR